MNVWKKTIAHIEKANKKWEETYDLLMAEYKVIKAELQTTKKELAEKKATMNALTALTEKYLKE